MMKSSIFLFAAVATAPDPSGGWLSYALYEANATDIITKLSCTMTVPADPLHRGAEPAFWFGVQTHKGDGALVQPIQAKWLGGEWDMFHEIFDWVTHHDSASEHYAVPAGDKVWAEVTYKASDNSYDMAMTSAKTGQSVSYNYKLNHRQHATEATAYFVLEHQPRSCNQLPPNGIVTWSNISMEVNYEAVASPVFKAMQESPTCGSKVEIVDPKTITLTWDVKEAKEAKAAKLEEE